MQDSPATRIESLKKSKSDNRNYLFKTLKNQMKVLIISDPEADKSAASLGINIGSLSDPYEFLGLAHFCEHMLFMGNEKYPKENEYSEFLNQNGGCSNAYTDQDLTNYFFEVSNEAFSQALDRFAQFFLTPLFLEDSVEREVQAVDSENKKNLQNDSWRFLQLQRSECNPNSVFNRFATGNAETLKKPGVRDALLSMHKKYYSSDLMALVILSQDSLQELEKLVDSLFTNVPKIEGLTRPRLDEVPAHDSTNTGYFYKIVPIKDSDHLYIYWFLPDDTKYYKQKPLAFLSSLFGHEGPNSLTSSLIKDDLISSLTSGADSVANTYSQFYLSMQLTQKGLGQYKNIIQRTLYYVRLIQSMPINKRYFDEIQKIRSLQFDFKNKEDPGSYCCDLSADIKNYANEDILTGGKLIEQYDEDLIKTFLGMLVPDNMNIYLISKSIEDECTMTETWYQTKFYKEKMEFGKFLSQDDLNVNGTNVICSHPLGYPPENYFIPNSLELLPEADDKPAALFPEKVLDEDGIVIWYKKDSKFKLPKAMAVCQIYLNKTLPGNEYVRNETISYLWNSIVQNELKELSYMAGEANVNFEWCTNYEGIRLEIRGFSESLMKALTEITKVFKGITSEDKEEKLKVHIERHVQDYANFYLKMPCSVGISYLDFLILEPSAVPSEKLNVLYSGLTIKDLTNFVKMYLQETRFEWLIQGNVLKEDAVSIGKACQDLLQVRHIPADQTIIYRTVLISPNTNFLYTFPNPNPDESNSAICSLFQCGKLDDQGTCILDVIESLLNEKFFDDMRTKQALGYIASLLKKDTKKNQGLVCVVQSCVKCPEYIWGKISEFMLANAKEIEEMSDEMFNTHVGSVLVEKRKKDLTLYEEVWRNEMEVKRRDFVFDRKEREISILENLKKEEVQKFFEKNFVRDVRRLDVEYISQCHVQENASLEEDNRKRSEEVGIRRVKAQSVMDFKRRNSLCPDYFSFK